MSAHVRSSTQFFTNRTFFSSSALREALPALVEPDRSPPASVLPTFLHEATHHWCFDSTVGTVTAVLEARGLWFLVRAAESASSAEAEALERRGTEDLVRAHAVQTFLQPLAEGMATFSEFDLVPSLHSPLAPPPLQWSYRFNAGHLMHGTRESRLRRRFDAASLTGIAIDSSRRSIERQRAKEALLASPLACVPGDGYLAGYLLMKSIWQSVKARHEGYVEPDTFVLWIQNTFYEDGELARLIVTPESETSTALVRIGNYLAAKMERAHEATTDELEKFHGRLESARKALYKDDDRGQILPLFHSLEPDPTAKFRAIWPVIFGAPLNELIPAPSSPDKLSDRFLMSLAAIGDSRRFLRLGEFVADIEIQGPTIAATADTGLIFELASLPHAPQGATTAAITVLLDSQADTQIVLATVGDQIVGTAFRPPNAQAQSLWPLLVGVGWSAGIDNVLGQLRSTHAWAIADGYTAQVRERLDSIYVPAALYQVPVDQLELMVAPMLEAGLFGAFRGDGDLLRALAIIGSSANQRWTEAALVDEFARRGLDYGRLMPRLKRLADETGLFRLKTDFGLVWSSL